MFIAVFLVIFAYLMGSLSSAIIVSKLLGLPDPRTQGSGNPGATNILRLGGKFPAIITLISDILKGLIPVLIANLANIHGFWLGVIALAAVVGHVFPVFFNFKGGKGVATALGAFIALNIWIGIIAIAVWLIVTAIWRYVSLASLIATWIATFYTVVTMENGLALPIIALAGLLTWRHWSNIERLRVGKENKLKL